MNGIFIIDKPKGITSRDVVDEISKKFNIKKVGHTGTLDPLATGVLVVCVGKATKLVSRLTSTRKDYLAEVTLGISTDTLDITGNVLQIDNIYENNLKEKIIDILSEFKGKYMQEVPLYSAVKVRGKKLYEYARENIKIDLPKREVEIFDIELMDIYIKDNHTCFSFKCSVSKGTYIRSLIKDICDKLNIKGCMSNLRRIKQGIFDISRAKLLSDISKEDIIDIKEALNIKKIDITDQDYFKIKNGQIIKNIYKTNEVMFLYKNQVIAIYKIYDKDNNLLKPDVMIGDNL